MTLHGVASQVYVWMQTYSRQGQKFEEHLDEVLSDIAAARYDGVETFASLIATPEQADWLRRSCDRYRLQLISLYQGGVYHTRDEGARTVEETVALARRASEVGCPALNINPNPIGRPKTDEELRIQGEYLNRLGAALKNLGMTLRLHHHDPEIRDDAREFRANCANTDPALVRLCLDLHWVLRGGGDPIALLREYGSQADSLHIRNSTGGVWSEALGDGDIDYRQVRATLEAVGFQGWLIVELAYEPQTVVTRPLAENIRLSREYVRTVFGQ
ncbi:MAG: TIM barrel protein [Candidatus Latescibacteria bacterium]|nr:TIM barrel protein [Candidatus Latescibacterota bacterium]